MRTINLKNILRANYVVPIFVFFTFLANTFVFIYVELYNSSNAAKYNSELISKNLGRICLSVKQPIGGMAFYHDIFYFGWYLIEASAILAIVSIILTTIAYIAQLFKISIFHYNKYAVTLFMVATILSWVLLFGAWVNTDLWLYNCAEMYY